MSPTMARWLFIGVIGRLIPLSTEQGQLRAPALMGWSHEMGQGSEQDLAQAIALYCQLAQAWRNAFDFNRVSFLEAG